MEQALVLRHRAAVDELRRALARERQVFEPRGGRPGPEWVQTDGTEPFAWSTDLPTPPKRFFFPAREPLLRWNQDDATLVDAPAAPFVLFGVRPCDAAAIRYQDMFFRHDRWYAARRGHAVLVVMNCAAACDGGFCTHVGAGPFAADGFDIALTLLPDDRVVVECGSAVGQAMVAATGIDGSALDSHTRSAYHRAAAAARASFAPRPFIARAIQRLNQGAVTDAEWHTLGPACFACSGCSNLCPTCSCYTLVDEGSCASGERVRYWDSCLLEGFQREASGHHPAPHPGDRVRRFWYHKFSSDFASAAGRHGCVGCGRCDQACLGTIGAGRVLAALGSP